MHPRWHRLLWRCSHFLIGGDAARLIGADLCVEAAVTTEVLVVIVLLSGSIVIPCIVRAERPSPLATTRSNWLPSSVASRSVARLAMVISALAEPRASCPSRVAPRLAEGSRTETTVALPETMEL